MSLLMAFFLSNAVKEKPFGVLGTLVLLFKAIRVSLGRSRLKEPWLRKASLYLNSFIKVSL